MEFGIRFSEAFVITNEKIKKIKDIMGEKIDYSFVLASTGGGYIEFRRETDYSTEPKIYRILLSDIYYNTVGQTIDILIDDKKSVKC